MALDHIVVVGGSLAGTRGAETLRREGFTGAITMVGAETELPYERPALSKQYLSGKWDRDRVFLRTDGDLAADLGIEIRLGTVALSLDLDGRRVLVEPVHADHSGAGDLGAGPSGEGDSGTGSSGAGESIGFDGLFIATGARVRELPGSKGLGGVHTLRTLADADRLKSDLARKPKVAVIGAGFIGSEVASTCRGLGLEVTVIEALPQPLSRVLGDEMGAILAGLHRQGGTDLRLGIGVDSLVGSGRVEGVKLAGGEVIGADVVVVGIGVVPNTEWLEGSGLTIDNGVVCDPACGAILVSGERAPGVVAAGDVARWHHGLFDERMRLEHWDNAILQAEHAARTLLAGDGAGGGAEREVQPYQEVGFFWSDQYGAKIQFVGTCRPDDDMRVAEGSVEDHKFIAAYGRGGTMVGALGVNRAFRMMAYRDMVANRAPFPPPPPPA